MTTSTIATTISTLLDQDQTRDAIIITLVTDHGITLNKATTEYATYAKDNGLTTVATSHKAAALEWIATEYSDWDHAAVADAVIEIQARYNVAESTARDYTKAYSKLLDVTHPTLNPRAAMFDYLVANPECDKEEFKAFAKDLGRSDSNINEYWKGMELHRAILAAS